MLTLDACVDGTPAIGLTLTFDERQKTRQRVQLDDGTWAALLLPRGTVLIDGTCLRRSDGVVVGVRAAPESVSSVETPDAILLARAAYHLGNRHVPLEIAPGRLRYLHDHVLDDLVRALGLPVRALRAPFQPEAGAYHGREHTHSHGNGHAHHHHD